MTNSKLKTSELLAKRDAAFDEQSNEINVRMQANMIPALKHYFETDNDIMIETLCVNVLNNNFIILFVSFLVNVGDTIRSASGEIPVTVENVDALITPIQLMLPLVALDKSTEEVELILQRIDSFAKKYSIDEYQKQVNEGKITSIDSLIDKTPSKPVDIKSDCIVDFDYNSLTNEQRDQLKQLKLSKALTSIVN